MADKLYETGIQGQRISDSDGCQSGAGNRKTDPRVRGNLCPRAIHAVSPSLRAHVLNPAGPQDPPGPGRRNTSISCVRAPNTRDRTGIQPCSRVSGVWKP